MVGLVGLAWRAHWYGEGLSTRVQCNQLAEDIGTEKAPQHMFNAITTKAGVKGGARAQHRREVMASCTHQDLSKVLSGCRGADPHEHVAPAAPVQPQPHAHTRQHAHQHASRAPASTHAGDRAFSLRAAVHVHGTARGCMWLRAHRARGHPCCNNMYTHAHAPHPLTTTCTQPGRAVDA